MALNTNATATIIIKGLALCKNVESAKKWQVLFLHPPNNNHKLKIWIKKINKNTGQEDFIQEPIMLNIRKKISITTVNGKVPSTIEYNNGNFGDDKDFCQVIQFEKLDNSGVELLPQKHTRTSYLSISNAVLYTYKNTPVSYEIKRKGGSLIVNRKIGYIVGGDVECNNNGKVIVNIEGLGVFNLDKQNNLKYEIFLDNVCTTSSCRSNGDYEDYYKFIKHKSGFEYELIKQPFKLVNRKRPILTDEAACNPGKGDPDCDLEQYYNTGNC